MPAPAPNPAPADKLGKQLAAIDALEAEGVLTPAAARTARAQLGRRQDGDPAIETRLPRGLVAGVVAFVLVVGAIGYATKGRPEAFAIGPGDSGASIAEASQQAQIEAMVQRLEERLKTQPDDAEGWTMLARSYSVQGRHQQAAPAWKRVAELRPKDAQSLADYADALAMVNNRSLDGEPEKLALQALQIDPANVKALVLVGTAAYNRRDPLTAIGLWERALKASDPESDFTRQLQGALAEARQLAGMPAVAAASAPNGGAQAAPAPAAPPPPVAAGAPAEVSGRVMLGAAAKAQVSPDDTVFIFARAPSGSRMPLAILRKKVSDLPLDFKLDDSLAMSPAARLSSSPQVIVGARISKTGNAMPSAGDWQALSTPVALGASGLRIEIDEPVR